MRRRPTTNGLPHGTSSLSAVAYQHLFRAIPSPGEHTSNVMMPLPMPSEE